MDCVIEEETIKDKTNEILNSIREDYFVEDIFSNINRVKVLFILESPHTKEIECGYPLAGHSGLILSDSLFNINMPFGLFLRKNETDEITGINPKNYAIMNVCNIPMQESAYEDEYNSSIIDDLRIIRENPLSTRRNKISTKILEELLIEDFDRRLKEKLDCRETTIELIVPCGQVARSFLYKTSIEEWNSASNNTSIEVQRRFEVYDDIKHPSRSNWKVDDVDSLKKKINKIVE